MRKKEKKSEVKEETKIVPIPAPAPKRIRMLMSLSNPQRSYRSGVVYIVGQDVSEETATSWLKSGAAEEAPNLPGPSETK